MLFATVFLLTVLLVVLTFLQLSRKEIWWIRGGDFPRLQLMWAGVLLIALQLSTLDLSMPRTWLLLASCFICVAYQAWWIWPYSFLHPKEVLTASHRQRHNRIRIMIANVLMTNRNARSLLRITRETDPDVLVTVEGDGWWQSQLDALEPDYRYTLKCPQDNKYGMHLYSRLPLEEAEIRFLVEPGCPSMHARVALPSGQRIQLHCLHPAPPSPTENHTSTERDAELITVARQAAQEDLPVIVTGDLNDVAWSATTRLFRKISGLLDPRIGRGMFNSFHAGHLFLRWPLDHLFHSRHFTLAEIRRLPGFGSDHFPIVVELVLQPDRAWAQEGIAPDKEDYAQAREKEEQSHMASRQPSVRPIGCVVFRSGA